jgi:hypothetical protein
MPIKKHPVPFYKATECFLIPDQQVYSIDLTKVLKAKALPKLSFDSWDQNVHI